MDLKKSKYILPNLFTLASVFFGLLAVFACMPGTDDGFRRAAIAILIAMAADGLDGRVARMTRTATRFGVQLDSLADVLSFGMAPAVLAYTMALSHLDRSLPWGAVLAFLFTACGALRLARFNLESDAAKKPSTTFTGLPIPAAAVTVALLAWAFVDMDVVPAARLALLAGVMPALALLMVSTVRYPNFKHVHAGLLGRVAMLLFIAAVIVLAWRTRASVVLLALDVTYIVLGPASFVVRLASRLVRRGQDRTNG